METVVITDKLTGRVKRIEMDAGTFEDQRFMGAVADVLENGGKVTAKPKGKAKFRYEFDAATETQ